MRFTDDSVARNVQNAKMKRSSRLLNLQRGLALLAIINAAVQSISLLPRFSVPSVQLMTTACSW